MTAAVLFEIAFLSTMFILIVKFTYRSIQTLLWMKVVKNIKPHNTGKFVSIIIPARNEAINIAECLSALKRLNYDMNKLEIIVVNDNSTDETASIVEGFANKSKIFRLVNAPALPDGWMGKNHACFVGAKEAKGDILLFIDADVTLCTAALIKTTAYMLDKELALLSINPSQLIESIGERLLLPGLFLSISDSMDFFAINDENSQQSLANGQFMMFDRQKYFELGNHETLKSILSEDIAMAKLYKGLGLKTAMLIDDGSIAFVRMYRCFLDSWRGFSKNLSEIIDANNIFTISYQVLRSLIFGVGSWWLLYLSFTENDYMVWIFTAVLWSVYASGVVALKVPIYYALGVPFGFIGFSYLSVDNYIKRKIKGARKWKGRRY